MLIQGEDEGPAEDLMLIFSTEHVRWRKAENFCITASSIYQAGGAKAKQSSLAQWRPRGGLRATSVDVDPRSSRYGYQYVGSEEFGFLIEPLRQG